MLGQIVKVGSELCELGKVGVREEVFIVYEVLYLVVVVVLKRFELARLQVLHVQL